MTTDKKQAPAFEYTIFKEFSDVDKYARRYNKGKVDYTMIPLDALEVEARVWMLGEEKYGPNNWTKLWDEDTPRVAMGSALRHIFAYLSGEDLDPESGVHHLAHVRCNAAMGIRYYNNKKKEADK